MEALRKMYVQKVYDKVTDSFHSESAKCALKAQNAFAEEKVQSIIAACWVAGSAIGFLPLFGWHSRNSKVPFVDEMCLFTEVMDYNYLVFLYLVTIIIPGLVLAGFYAHIYQVVIKQLRQIVTMNPMPSGATSTRSVGGTGTMLRMLGAAQKREVKATQNLSIIVLFFIICWFPLYTINCFQAFCRTCSVPSTATSCCIILSHLNSAGNPLLYAYHLRDFRAALKNLFCDMFGRVDSQNTNGQYFRPSIASQNILQHHVINNNSRNNSMQSIQNVGRVGFAGHHVYSDSPKVRLSRMMLPSTSTVNANNLSMTSVTSGLSTVHETAVCVPMYVNRQQGSRPNPPIKVWTGPEGEPSQMSSMNCPKVRSVSGRFHLQGGSSGHINSAYIEDGMHQDDEEVIAYCDEGEDQVENNDEEDVPAQNPSVIFSLNEHPFSYRDSFSTCDDTVKVSSRSPMSSSKLSITEKQTLSLTTCSPLPNGPEQEFLPNSSSGHILLVQAEINTCENDDIQLSPRNSKISIIGNGNSVLKRADLKDNNKPTHSGNRRISSFKAVSDFLLGSVVNKAHRLKDLESNMYHVSTPGEEASNSSHSSQHHNGQVGRIQIFDESSGNT